ncbi:MAG: carboxy terminal-processing peptidase, partial [Deltaproteobacteria bacterium]|nr:carboxy terminal-processing peptidase [Deltaproteobacteria bacterium]
LLPLLDKKHEARVAKDKDFQYLAEDIALVKKQRKDNLISLNETLRRKERETQDARAKLREARLLSPTPGADDPILIPDPKDVAKQLLAAKAGNGKTTPAKVAAVKVALLKTDTRMASRVLPYAVESAK